MRLSRVGGVGYLDSLEAEPRAALESIARVRRYRRGEVVFSQGEQPQDMVILLNGLVKVTRCSGTGRDVILEFIFPGEICGALCALDCNPYPATGECVTDSAVMRVERGAFLRAAEEFPALLLKATQYCRAKVRRQREMMVGMAVERAEQRAARGLLILAEGLGKVEDGILKFSLPISRREFSELIGTTLETAIRILSRFRKEGYIRENEGYMELVNLEALQELAQFE